MAGDEALVMISLVIILALLCGKRSFIQQMGLSLEMRRMRRNVSILSIQQQNNIQRRKCKTVGLSKTTVLA